MCMQACEHTTKTIDKNQRQTNNHISKMHVMSVSQLYKRSLHLFIFCAVLVSATLLGLNECTSFNSLELKFYVRQPKFKEKGKDMHFEITLGYITFTLKCCG